MAKRNVELPSSSDKAKVRVLFAEVEGNNESVQEALRTMVSAMNRTPRVVTEPRANGRTTLPPSTAADEQEMLEQTEEFEESDEETEAAATRKPRGTGKKTDRNSGLTLVPNLNFRPGGNPTLKEFIDAKKPSNDRETTLALVYFMQHTMALEKIGPSHVLTGFKEAGTSIPVDLRQTIRNVKTQRMWLNFSDIEDLRTTTQGDNFVEHEMGKSG
ncbi:MAG TPA: hypothetical protein VGM17_03125 [Rhizomicrobium sp.]|jgi:hypothetical protein